MTVIQYRYYLEGLYYNGDTYKTSFSTKEGLNEELEAIASLDNINHRGIYGDENTVRFNTVQEVLT